MLTINETAKLLNVSKWTVYRLIANGKLSFKNVGNGKNRVARITQDDIDSFLNSNTKTIETSRKEIPTPRYIDYNRI